MQDALDNRPLYVMQLEQKNEELTHVINVLKPMAKWQPALTSTMNNKEASYTLTMNGKVATCTVPLTTMAQASNIDITTAITTNFGAVLAELLRPMIADEVNKLQGTAKTLQGAGKW